MKRNRLYKWLLLIVMASVTQKRGFAQQKVGDNLGSHKASKALDMNTKDIDNAGVINATGAVIGTAVAINNSSIALQVNGEDKAILVPRVNDLLNPASPSIPVANAINGMIVYDLATEKFYLRQNGAWQPLGAGFVDLISNQTIKGVKTFASDTGFVVNGVLNTVNPVPPVTGAGSRMMWYAGKVAFRAGSVDGNQWDAANIGNYSVAMGRNITVNGGNSIALGVNTTVSGSNSFAFGRFLSVNAGAAFALGSYINASNLGSFAIGDASTVTATNTDANNQFIARFAGGYKFYTSADASTYVAIAAGANGMSITSDRNKKENFEAIDSESFLKKIGAMSLGSWNYKGQDAKTFRHYGPMAQDFYAAFGKDTYGTIGNDTTISSADFDGVNLIAIQGLVKRTDAIQRENERLKAENKALSQALAKHKEQADEAFAELNARLNEREEAIVLRLKQVQDLVQKLHAMMPANSNERSNAILINQLSGYATVPVSSDQVAGMK